MIHFREQPCDYGAKLDTLDTKDSQLRMFRVKSANTSLWDGLTTPEPGSWTLEMIERIRQFWNNRKQRRIYNVFHGRMQTTQEYHDWKRARQEKARIGEVPQYSEDLEKP